MARRVAAGQLPAPPAAEVVPPPGLHHLRREAGALSCARCQSAAGSGRWYVLAFKPCPAELDLATGQWAVPACTVSRWAWRRTGHVVETTLGQVHCKRCMGRVPAHRAAVFRRSKCPAWRAEWIGEPAAPPDAEDWGQRVHALMGSRAAGCRRGAPAQCAGPAGAAPVSVLDLLLGRGALRREPPQAGE